VLLPLEQTKETRPWVRGMPWASCKPFVENTFAALIHRPRMVAIHRISEKYRPHISVSMWCGSTQSGTKKFTFLDAPPNDRIVCARCEEKATDAGLPSSTALAGEHVHTGGVVAVAYCCTQEGISK